MLYVDFQLRNYWYSETYNGHNSLHDIHPYNDNTYIYIYIYLNGFSSNSFKITLHLGRCSFINRVIQLF